MTELRKPYWLQSSKLGSRKTGEITRKLRSYNLHTVCESARCPNRGECFERGTATFMILGDQCTRNCSFCAIEKKRENLAAPSPEEPVMIARLSRELDLKHIVITTVTRDDLEDGGAGQFVRVIEEIRNHCEPDVTIEVLISDLQGRWNDLKKILKAGPDILNHNLETVRRLYPEVRPLADYDRSLHLLGEARKFNPSLLTKSGFMVGLGETCAEINDLLTDLRSQDVDILTIGQYLAPSKKHYPVAEYIRPDVFAEYRQAALRIGFKIVESGPLVRSSYHAERARKILKRR
ncbi:MAG: lipoyl synthase [Candidatus Cloacimonetes bacterium]|nr:lipoyl synthase [Candidatus Cloacimonadota bacterium]